LSTLAVMEVVATTVLVVVSATVYALQERGRRSRGVLPEVV
jgi:hypothetical protein